MEERLQKYIARCGVASRRKSEELILAGNITVNDINVTELGVKINPDKDIIKYNNTVINPEKNKIYIMLNKPEGYITSVNDEKGRSTILDLVKVDERIFPIGRLDYDSSGLLILTNDGDIYNKIIHPREIINKIYIAECKGRFTENDIKKFKAGIDIGGYITSDADIEVIDEEKKGSQIISTVEIKIHEGKNRQIRKMCSALNHDVLTLKRVSIGKLQLGNLKKGSFRNLTEQELKYIKSL